MTDYYPYHVYYYTWDGDKESDVTFAHSEERACELIKNSDRCKEVISAERQYSWH